MRGSLKKGKEERREGERKGQREGEARAKCCKKKYVSLYVALSLDGRVIQLSCPQVSRGRGVGRQMPKGGRTGNLGRECIKEPGERKWSRGEGLEGKRRGKEVEATGEQERTGGEKK